MKSLLSLITLLCFTMLTFAQEVPKELLHKDKNDPEAAAILDKVKKNYDSYKTLAVDFTMAIEIPESPVETQKGQMKQEGNKFYIDLPQSTIYCDGESVWLHMKNNQEVQINDYDAEEMAESGEILSPKDIIKAYEQGKYLYVLMNEAYEDGVMIQQIEFKPKDRDSEFSKMRVTIDKKKSQITRIKVFSRDGSRYTLTVDKMEANKPFNKATFSPSSSAFPKGVHIEDLRM